MSRVLFMGRKEKNEYVKETDYQCYWICHGTKHHGPCGALHQPDHVVRWRIW